MSEPTQPTDPADREWSRTCGTCGTELRSAVIDFDKSNADRPEMRPGEMASVDFCPNRDCPDNKPEGSVPAL